jgi:hypothetical chaperone protein
MSSLAIGIDFGTTNSSIAAAGPDGAIDLLTENYRSLLYLEQVRERNIRSIKCWSGPAAIEEYLAADTKGRLVQSLKSFLSSRTLKGTEVFGRRMTLEDLIARILRDLREKAETHYGRKVRRVVAGRPVRFVGSQNEDDDRFAEGRLRDAFGLAGYEAVSFEPEPVAAAAFYESTLDHNELILIGDFGGGTSDFSLLRVGPSASGLLGNSGLGLAGDAFDAKIVRHLVSPALGRGSLVRSFEKTLPAVPNWVYAKLEHWHHLSFLQTGSVINMLKTTRAEAFEPEKIEALLEVIQEDLGYYLHRAVQQLKRDLSSAEAARFSFHGIEAVVERADFEKWIGEELAQIETCVDRLLARVAIHPGDIDRVFLTGGTSFVPAVRRIFESRFGSGKIRGGNEFTSVAAGLALLAARRTKRGAVRSE